MATDIDTGYLVLRAVITAITRRIEDLISGRHVHVGELHIDTAARTLDINGEPVKTTRLEFDLLRQLATDPTRVFTKDELQRALWGPSAHGRGRTVDSHAARLRRRLTAAGADGLVISRFGVGYHLAPHD